MFVRKKRNKSGAISIQVIDKANGYRVVKTIGSTRDPEEVDRLVALGKRFIQRQSKQLALFPKDQRDNAAVLDFVQTLRNASIPSIGPELIFGRLFDEIGFDAIPEPLFRDIVVARLRKRIGSGKLTKEYLNNRGYNKFLKLAGEVTVEIDGSMIEQDARWDGLKGYLTSTDLSPTEAIDNYGHLWQIERAFRISKTDLRIRPRYHRRRRRIEAHVLTAFVAYTIHKELERRLYENSIPISPRRVAELTQTMYERTFNLPGDPEEQKILLQMDPDQQQIHEMLN